MINAATLRRADAFENVKMTVSLMVQGLPTTLQFLAFLCIRIAIPGHYVLSQVTVDSAVMVVCRCIQ